MADGRTHEIVAQTTLVAGSLSALLISSQRPDLGHYALWFCIGLANGLVVTPDIDMPTLTREEQRWYQIPLIGWLLGSGYFVFWWLYARIFTHRGISHAPIFGTLTRIVYQYGVLELGNYAAVVVLGKSYEPVFAQLIYYDLSLIGASFAYVSGWMIQDYLHVVFDVKSVPALMWVSLVMAGHLWFLGFFYGL